MLDQVDRAELCRLREVERRARAMFMQTGDETVAAHVQLALSAPDDLERLRALERALILAGSLAAGANDKLLSRVHALHQALAAGGHS